MLALLAAFINLRAPLFPGVTIDHSWVLSTDHAVRTGAVFGRDYVFTYGPYFRLSTRLFDPNRFGLVVAYDLITPLLVCAPAIRHRSVLGVAGVVGLMFLNPWGDALVMAALLAVFLTAVMRRDVWAFAAVAICGPLMLSKLSLALVLPPLLLLADARWAVRRKAPLLTLTLLISMLASLLLAHQPISALPAFAANSLAIILGYGRAMQVFGPASDLIAALILSGLVLLLAAALAIRTLRQGQAGRSIPAAIIEAAPAIAAIGGLCWYLFIAIKAGFVRQDAHPVITFDAIGFGLVVTLGFLARPSIKPERVGAVALTAVALLTAGAAARGHVTNPELTAVAAVGQALRQTVSNAPGRLRESASWLSASHWAAMTATRSQALISLWRPFPAEVSGTVDVIPHDLAEVIVSGLNYSPRPVMQSYSAYTPGLQALDRAHFAGPKAPQTLFLKLADIDGRLPTGALGPSLPVIASRYDAVGLDKLGVILRKRTTPRPVVERRLGQTALPLNRWIAVPPPGGGVVMGRFDLAPSLAGRVVGFLYRDPRLVIHLRSAKGIDRAYRFVPGMAALGTAISPLPSEGALGAMMLLDPAANRRADPVVALMLEARPWAYRPGKVAFSALDIPEGSARGLGDKLDALANEGLLADLALSDVSKGAVLDGDEIFAHAPTTLAATTVSTVVLSGAAGLRPHPADPPSDGVRFSVQAIDPKGAATVLFEQTLTAAGAEVPFRVTVPADSRLVLKTDVVKTSDYDWSFWRLRVAAPTGG